MLTLGIESSCDETAAAVVERRGQKLILRSSVVLSQINIHKKFGGVVPEVAARKHLENILPVVSQALEDAGVTMEQIDQIAVTRGPGLVTSLLVGAQAAKTLAYLYDKPLLGVNHLEGHILVNWLTSPESTPQNYSAIAGQAVRSPELPAVCLIVSGGHTEIVLAKKIGQYKKLGQTLDDAAGECFDKIAKMLGLGYPGGPALSAKAKNGRPSLPPSLKLRWTRKLRTTGRLSPPAGGDGTASWAGGFDLPRPMINSGDFNFSFSGLKTHVLYYLQKNGRPTKQTLNDFCAAVEEAIVDVLVSKTIAAAKQTKAKTVIIGGGVTANHLLRETLAKRLAEELPKVKFLPPALDFCADNAAMIATVGGFYQGKKDVWRSLTVDPNLEI